jgi:hypothetical protein
MIEPSGRTPRAPGRWGVRAIVFALEQPARMTVARMVVVSAHKV